MGLGGAQTDCEGVLGQNSLALGTWPIHLSLLVAQLSRACLCGTGLMGVLAVVDGVGSHTSSWISSITSCPSVVASHCSVFHSSAPSSFSTPFPSFSLLTSGSSLYCCLIFVVALFESMAVVVVVSWIAGVAVEMGVEMVVVVVLVVLVMCRMSTAGSAG